MAFWQKLGIEVIPNVCWSDESSYSWCFDGLPQNSILAVSTNGCLKDKVAKQLFIAGFNEMKRRLNPLKIVIVGTLPKELEKEKNIIKFSSYTSLFGMEKKSLTYRGET